MALLLPKSVPDARLVWKLDAVAVVVFAGVMRVPFPSGQQKSYVLGIILRVAQIVSRLVSDAGRGKIYISISYLWKLTPIFRST